MKREDQEQVVKIVGRVALLALQVVLLGAGTYGTLTGDYQRATLAFVMYLVSRGK